MDAFGFDTCDAFMVDRRAGGQDGISFTLKDEAAWKYRPKPASQVDTGGSLWMKTEPIRPHHWWNRSKRSA